jgi:hypothetical protein
MVLFTPNGTNGYPTLANSMNAALDSNGGAGGTGQTGSAQVSDYAKFYGTYSGADIKVIVHYPNFNEDIKLAQAIKVEQEIAYEEHLKELQSVTDPQLKASLNAELMTIIDSILELDEAISKYTNIPTSKTLFELQTISISAYRDKGPVRPLGSV